MLGGSGIVSSHNSLYVGVIDTMDKLFFEHETTTTTSTISKKPGKKE